MIITVSFQKGGVGKSTIAAHLAWGLPGRRVIIDLDPQANLTSLFKISNPEKTAQLLFTGMAYQQCLIGIDDDLAIIPSTFTDFDLDVSLNLNQREQAISLFNNEIRKIPADYVIIDCGPGQTTQTIAAQMSADLIVIPVECRDIAREGLLDLIPFLHQYTPAIPRIIVPNKVDARVTSHKEIAEELLQEFGENCLSALPLNTAIEDIWTTYQPAWTKMSKGGEAMKLFITEIKSWLSKQQQHAA